MWLMKKRLKQSGYEVCTIDYETVGIDVIDLLSESSAQIETCLKNKKTHFVGHSLGGLVIKNYLSSSDNLQKIADLGEVVFVGTPNKGSDFADALKDHYAMSMGGEIGPALMTGPGTLGNQIGTILVPAGVIAGSKGYKVTEKYFDQPNDGLVSVASTRLTNMKDFIVLEVSHSAMRYDKQVIEQVLNYLDQGHFKH